MRSVCEEPKYKKRVFGERELAQGYPLTNFEVRCLIVNRFLEKSAAIYSIAINNTNYGLFLLLFRLHCIDNYKPQSASNFQIIHMTMMKRIKTTDQLANEILMLQRENQKLSAELAFHRKVFKEVHRALGAADELSEAKKKSGAVRQLLEENEKLKSQLKISRLSEREREVLKFIVNGYKSREIADQLNISKLTVDTHRKRIQQKLEVSNMVELVKIALASDWA